MKICLINEFYKPYILGGVETYLNLFANELISQGNEVFVISTNPVDSSTIDYVDGIKVYRITTDNIHSLLDSPNKNMLEKIVWSIKRQNSHKSYLKVKEILEKERPTIVHTNNLYSLSTSIFSAVKELNIPIVHEIHDYNMICIKNNLIKSNGKVCHNKNILCKTFNNVKKKYIKNEPDFIITPTNFAIKEYQRSGFFKNTPFEVIPHGIKIPKKVYEKEYNPLNILYVGTLSKQKGIETLLKATRLVNKDNLMIHICGRGQYENKIRKESESNKKIIFHGYVTPEELDELYSNSNALIVPSEWYEVFGIVIIEAIAHNTPVIASKIGGIPETVINGQTGYLFEPGNQKELAEIINQLSIEDLKIIEKKIEKIKWSYTISERINKIIRIYQSLTTRLKD